MRPLDESAPVARKLYGSIRKPLWRMRESTGDFYNPTLVAWVNKTSKNTQKWNNIWPFHEPFVDRRRRLNNRLPIATCGWKIKIERIANRRRRNTFAESPGMKLRCSDWESDPAMEVSDGSQVWNFNSVPAFGHNKFPIFSRHSMLCPGQAILAKI